MAPKQPNGVQLVFLPPNNRSGDGLDSTARGHASRQGHSRSAKKRAATGPAQVRGRKPVGGGSGPGHVAGRYLEKHDQYCCCSGCSGQDGRDVDQSALIGVQKVKIYDKQRRMQHAASPARFVVDRDIGSGDLDPFNTSTVAGLSSSERYLLHYALTATTGSFGESPEIKRNFAHSWTCRSLENMSTLHANVLGGSVHYLLNCPDLMPAHQIRAVSLAAKGRALQNLRAEIDLYYRRPDAVNADNLLLTIFVLGIHADVVPGPAPSRPRWSSPLADCRDLGVYSRMCFGSEHMEAMYTLIEERGGVKNICNTTFGCVIPLTDMLYSFRQGVTPRLPSHYTVQQIRDTEVWRPDAEANLMLATLGSAFRKDSGALPLILQLGPEITETLLTLAEITAAVDQYVRGGTGAPDTLDVLLNNIDWASHRLLSQPSYLAQIKGKKKKKGSIKEKGKSGDVKTTGLGSRRPVLRELCRLASLLYLNMVMLPYGPHGEVRHRISRQVLDLLVSDDGPLSWANRGDGGGDDEDDGGNQGPVWDFLLWVACLGAVSGQGTPLEEKYAGFLRDHGRLRMGWAAARERVKRFLWWDHVCEEPALLMWADAAGELS